MLSIITMPWMRSPFTFLGGQTSTITCHFELFKTLKHNTNQYKTATFINQQKHKYLFLLLILNDTPILLNFIFYFSWILYFFCLFSFYSGSNSCQLNNGGCSQLCLPTSETTRTCMCTVGYYLQKNRMSCQGIRSWKI